MTKAVAPAVREAALTRTCPECRAAPGQKCAPGPGGRSNLHRHRILDAKQALEPMPPYQILPPDGDRTFMEMDPDDADTFVFSVHHDVMASLVLCPDLLNRAQTRGLQP